MFDAGVVQVAAEVVRLAGLVAAIYLTVALAAALLQAQIGAASGTPSALAHVSEHLLGVVFAFAVAVSAQPLGDEVAGLLSQADGPGALRAVWGPLAQLVVRLLILSGGALLAVSIVGGSFAAQVATLAGQPHARGVAVVRLLLAVLTGVLTLFAVQLADLITGAVL